MTDKSFTIGILARWRAGKRVFLGTHVVQTTLSKRKIERKQTE